MHTIINTESITDAKMPILLVSRIHPIDQQSIEQIVIKLLVTQLAWISFVGGCGSAHNANDWYKLY